MPHWVDRIKEEMPLAIAMGLTGILSLLLKKIWGSVYPLIPKDLLSQIPQTTLMYITLLCLILTFASLAFSCFLMLTKSKTNKIPEPTIHYGIYWDYLFKPLCPSCKAPLRVEDIGSFPLMPLFGEEVVPKLICPNGHFNNHLVNNLGYILHPSKARSELMDLYCEVVKIEEKPANH